MTEKVGTIERILNGGIDFHVHADPDPFTKRRLDVIDLALQAKAIGMRAVVAKNHQFGTALMATLVNQMVADFTLIGSIALNREVGGLDPDVVLAAAKAGAKVIWMPTISSVIASKGRPGIPLINEAKKLRSEIHEVLSVVKQYNMTVGTGHVGIEEIFALVEEAQRQKIRITVTHPLLKGPSASLDLEQERELVSMGAVMEHTFVACLPDLGGMSPNIIIDHVRGVGVDNCILSTDSGQDVNPSPPETFRSMIGTMLKFGLSEGEMEILVKTNPARLLGLT
jgi:hypothetical protein